MITAESYDFKFTLAIKNCIFRSIKVGIRTYPEYIIITVEKIRKSLELAVKNSGVNVVYATAEIADENTVYKRIKAE